MKEYSRLGDYRIVEATASAVLANFQGIRAGKGDIEKNIDRYVSRSMQATPSRRAKELLDSNDRMKFIDDVVRVALDRQIFE